MLLNEKLLNSSIFGEIQKIESFPFFKENATVKMDALLTYKYGTRIVYSNLENTPIADIADMIVTLYRDDWNKLIDLNALNINIGSSDTVKYIEKVTNTENRVNKQDNINTISAFDSDELVNNDGSNSNSSEDTTGDKNREYLLEKINLESVFNNLSLQQKTNIINVVTKDVATFLTLSIY